MSFDVYMHRFVDGEPMEVDQAPVRAVLERTTHVGPDEFGYYVLEFPDGVETVWSAEGLESEESFDGGVFHIRGFGGPLAQFIYDVAVAGDMVVIPAMENTPVVFVSERQEDDVPAEILEELRPIFVRSADELGAVLTGGYDGWSAYRDRVFSDR